MAFISIKNAPGTITAKAMQKHCTGFVQFFFSPVSWFSSVIPCCLRSQKVDRRYCKSQWES